MNARPKINLELAAKLWSQGMPSDEIADELGIGLSSFEQLAHRNRDLLPSRQKGNPVPDAEYLKRRLSNTSIKALATELRITPSAICVKLRRAGMGRGKEAKAVRAAPVFKTPPVAPQDCVVRTTSIGAKVTMPRLTFLDGPASEAI